ncbi:MAG: N-acetylmuramoyl-L-alanine amidase [Cyanobacteriota/Melainabacteria group bacterium]
MSKEVVSNPAAHRAAPLEAAESKQRTTQRDGAAQEMHRDSYKPSSMDAERNTGTQDKGQEKSLDKGQEKAQEKGPLSERTDNKSVADAADFSSKPKGSPEERELRKVLDDVRRDGSLVAPEKQLKSLIDLRRMHSPNETGLHHQEVGKFSTRQEYNPADRPDRLQRFTRQDINGAETITRDYHGRVDQLLQEESARGKNSQSYKRVFQEGKGPEGLTSEEYARVNGDKLVEAFKKVYDPKANAEGLKEHSWTKTDKGEITIKDFAGRKDGLVSFENVDKGADGTVKSRIFANRGDKLISENEVSKGDESSIARKYSDGAIERIKTGADKSVDRTRTNADGTSIVEHTSGDGKSRETQVRDSKNRVISINGEDPRGKYVASEIAGEGRDVITQRKYLDGTTVTKFPDGKSGPQGAREVVQEAGKQPRLFDAQGKEISTPKHKGDVPDKGPLEVATRFNENGTVQKTFADGSNTLTSLKDHVEKSSPATLGKEVRDLTKLAKTGSTDTSSAAINGLFKALQSEHQVPGQPEKFFSAKFALQELRTGSNTAPIVQAEALNQLASPDSHTRSVSANLVANNVEHWGPKDVKAITSNPSIEMATALSKLTPEQLKPHKSAIEEGVKEAAKHDPAETVDATRGKFGAIGVLAATGGAEALKAAGYDVKDVNNFAVIETKNGIKLTFDKQPNSALRLRSAEGPGKMDGDSESASFDAGTGEISKLTTRDRYGEFTERAFKDTERGLVRQRSYDKSKLVRTIFEGSDKEGKSGNMEVQHIPGKPPVVIDAKGDKATAPTNAAIPLATSFEDPQQPKTVFSDGSVLTRPIKDYVGMSDGKELAKHTDKFETLAVNGSEPAKQAGIDALVKLYAGDNPEHFKAAQEALVRLSAKGLGGEIGKSILESQSGRQRLSRESAATNKTVSLIAATAGYPGLAGAGLKIDHDNNTGTLADGTRYEFGTTDKGRMQPISMVDKEGKRHDFDYNEAGQMTGKHLSDRQGDAPTKKTTDNSWSKYEGMKMPSIQKGWGPYQALEQMRSEGKIEMSGKEMKAVAEFIRDRDFAKSGEKFYKTGDKLEMPSAAELAKIKAGVGSAPNSADESSARRQRRESESQPDAATHRNSRRRSRSRGIEPHVPGSERDERRDAPERETDRERGYRPDGRDKSEEPYDGGAADGVNMRRTFNDRKTFFRAQNDSHSCSAFAMGMMAADHLKGSPISDKEATGFKKLAGTTSHGYRGSLDDMASQLKSVGLNTKAYKFDKFGDEEMKALNAELDKGHTAVARVQNDRTGNSHYIYVAGRDNDGNYIIGDPDRRNKNNTGPISPERLKKLMSNRMPDGGFVAGWAAKEGKAENIPGSIAFRNAHTRNSRDGADGRDRRREGSRDAGGDRTEREGDDTGERDGRRSKLEVISSHRAKSSGYFPYNDSMEGGHFDRKGKPLRTLQDYLAGRADYVSVAMDRNVAPYGTRIRIPELEAKYGREIDFRLVDTGRAFKNKGTSKIDICVKTRQQTYEDTINGHLTVQFVRERQGQDASSDSRPDARKNRPASEGDHYRNSRRRDDAGRDDAERRAARDDQKQAPGQVRLKGGLRPVVVIDAGHGGHDSGATVQGVQEKRITQDIATRVSNYLQRMGIAVERTNPHGGFRELSERSSIANRVLGKEEGRRPSDRHIADAFVSIHANHDGSNKRGGGRARGFQTYYHGAKSGDGSDELADTIHRTVVNADGLDVTDAGKSSKKAFHVIRKPKSPAVLLETGFLTNDRDRANLSKPEYRDDMAKRIALGIARYLNGRNPRTKP